MAIIIFVFIIIFFVVVVDVGAGAGAGAGAGVLDSKSSEDCIRARRSPLCYDNTLFTSSQGKRNIVS
ncbi:uncharacterized protein TrAtP1_002914 [Trichoderma atroviride]|uniref:uncharacterized protein n=1 Tax=Hypocrea atroviridis TaxID=63577 RepID=UPI0033324D3B|nr:hypothetical protein TrAtP1_002914 [Trichoderma atroviride]